jgi:hypothetical protein
MQQRDILKAAEIVKKTMNRLFAQGKLNSLCRLRLNKILRALKKQYLLNMLVYIPARNPRIAIEWQTFKRFIAQFCLVGEGYLSVTLSSRLRFKTEDDLHR